MKKIYGKIRSRLNEKHQGHLSRLVFLFSGKPTVKRDNIDLNKNFPNKEKGGLIVSADFEMAWAWRYTKTGVHYIKKGRAERQNFPRILKTLEDYDIPITFATVGHLFLEKCQAGEHDWMTRIPHFDDHWKFTQGDWFDHDPYSDYRAAQEWYAPDLIRMIQDSKVKHEVGSHTFTHIDFSYKNCPAQVAEDEIKACIQAARPYGIDLQSIVFPGGTWGNIEVLKKHGFKIYRKRCDFELSYPFRDEQGLLVSASSGCLEHNLNYGWSADYFLSRLEKYVNKAVQTGTIAHLWFHPSLDPYFLDNIFPRFFHYAAKLRDKGDLWIGPMSRIAAHINNNQILQEGSLLKTGRPAVIFDSVC
jgi:peptidoglycan/xylan/chitin deacetylase (PgdA/CDA1 family)